MAQRSSLLPTVAVGLGVAVYATAVGFLTLENRLLAVFAALAAVMLALAAVNAAWLAVIAVAGIWVIKRAPGLDVSYTDMLVAAAGTTALISGIGRTLRPSARTVLISFVVYLGTLSVTLAYNHSLRSDFEWFHRIALVAGALLLGAWLVRAELQHIALRALLAVTVGMSLFAVVESASSGFAPAYPFGYQKNFIGSIAATLLLVILAAPREFRLSPGLLRLATVATAGGLLASQSRGAMAAFAVGVVVWWARSRSQSAHLRRRTLVLIFTVVVVGVVALSVRNQLGPQATSINSLTLRIEVEQATRQLWLDHPLTGVGLRFFKTPEYAGYQSPTNVVNEVLAEAGALGLIGFLVFVVGSVTGLARTRGDLATAALCVVVARFVHGLFDIYWTGGTTALPWMVAGMALAVSASQAGGEPVPPLSSRRPFPR